jgi:hypothetical protein
MKVNLAFLHSFSGGVNGEGNLTSPLTITGDENAITLTKGDKYDEWLNNTTLVRDTDSPGGVSNIAALNRRTLFEAIEAWVNGEEYGRQVWTGEEE